MTPAERERLAKVEVKVETLDEWMAKIDGKVDMIVAAAHMGKGAWLLLLKLGTAAVVIGTAVAWGTEKFMFLTRKL